MHQQGCQVTGYDISNKAVEKAKAYIDATNDFREIPQETGIFVVCVSTKQNGGNPDFHDAIREVKKPEKRARSAGK